MSYYAPESFSLWNTLKCFIPNVFANGACDHSLKEEDDLKEESFHSKQSVLSTKESTETCHSEEMRREFFKVNANPITLQYKDMKLCPTFTFIKCNTHETPEQLFVKKLSCSYEVINKGRHRQNVLCQAKQIVNKRNKEILLRNKAMRRNDPLIIRYNPEEVLKEECDKKSFVCQTQRKRRELEGSNKEMESLASMKKQMKLMNETLMEYEQKAKILTDSHSQMAFKLIIQENKINALVNKNIEYKKENEEKDSKYQELKKENEGYRKDIELLIKTKAESVRKERRYLSGNKLEVLKENEEEEEEERMKEQEEVIQQRKDFLESKRKEEENKKRRDEEELKRKQDELKKKREEEEEKKRVEAIERRKKEEADRKAKEEQDKLERQLKEEQLRKAQQEEARKIKEEEERKSKEEEARKLKEEEDTRIKEEKEKAEKLLQEEQEKKLKEEKEREERKLKEDQDPAKKDKEELTNKEIQKGLAIITEKESTELTPNPDNKEFESYLKPPTSLNSTSFLNTQPNPTSSTTQTVFPVQPPSNKTAQPNLSQPGPTSGQNLNTSSNPFLSHIYKKPDQQSSNPIQEIFKPQPQTTQNIPLSLPQAQTQFNAPFIFSSQQPSTYPSSIGTSTQFNTLATINPNPLPFNPFISTQPQPQQSLSQPMHMEMSDTPSFNPDNYQNSSTSVNYNPLTFQAPIQSSFIQNSTNSSLQPASLPNSFNPKFSAAPGFPSGQSMSSNPFIPKASSSTTHSLLEDNDGPKKRYTHSRR